MLKKRVIEWLIMGVVAVSETSQFDNTVLSKYPSVGDNDGMYTSSADLEGLLITESEVVNHLQHYLDAEYLRLQKLEKVVQDYKSLRDRARRSSERFIGNPLDSFLLIKKLTSDWNTIQELVQNEGENFLNNITLERQSLGLRWPKNEDLNGAAVGLLRLQDTYRLDTSSLADGVLNGKYYGPHLSAQDCFELGRQSYNNGDYFHTNIWMEEAIKQLSKEKEQTIRKSDILEYLAFAAYKSGNLRKAAKLTIELVSMEPEHPRAHGNLDYYKRELAKYGANLQQRGEDGLGDPDELVNVMKELRNREAELGEERSNYERLCRGEDFISADKSSSLKCSYNFGRHPFMKLCPAKMEEVYDKPRIVIFHGMITDQEIETIKILATPRFRRATVQNQITGELETANYRVSKTAWLKESEHKHVASIYKKAHQLTGLNMETSEELQVSNYGIGGHYEPHFDFARKEEKNAFSSLGTGNRIATWLMYESDVEQGGYTVFPNLGISLKPKKGDVAFWYNLFANGEGDEMTRHAACPVLAGTKWVSNFWIHERGQEFTRPCTTDPYE